MQNPALAANTERFEPGAKRGVGSRLALLPVQWAAGEQPPAGVGSWSMAGAQPSLLNVWSATQSCRPRVEGQPCAKDLPIGCGTACSCCRSISDIHWARLLAFKPTLALQRRAVHDSRRRGSGCAVRPNSCCCMTWPWSVVTARSIRRSVVRPATSSTLRAETSVWPTARKPAASTRQSAGSRRAPARHTGPKAVTPGGTSASAYPERLVWRSTKGSCAEAAILSRV